MLHCAVTVVTVVLQKDMLMDHMERWGRIGGSDFIVGFMEYAPDGGCNPLNNCGTFGLKNSSRDTQSPKWLGCVSMCLRWSCQHSSAS